VHTVVKKHSLELNQTSIVTSPRKVVQAKSKLPMEVLLELADESRSKVMETSKHLALLMPEFDADNEKAEELKSELAQIHTWSQIFDGSDSIPKR
jgi:hypothetical protein